MEQLCIEFDTFQIVTHILRLGPEGLSGLLQAPESPVVDADFRQALPKMQMLVMQVQLVEISKLQLVRCRRVKRLKPLPQRLRRCRALPTQAVRWMSRSETSSRRCARPPIAC